MFRDNKITYRQFQARIFERKGAKKIMVLDDIMPDLHDSIKKIMVERPETLKLRMSRVKNLNDLLRPREEWEQNEHCLRSIVFIH